jgi:type I restriction enzyme S subunit
MNWPIRPLGELTVNHDGKRRPVKEADRRPGPYPYYGASGVVDYVDDYLIDGDYLLVAEDGENLRTRQTPIAFMARGKSWVNNHAHIVTGNTFADTRYLMYALQAADIGAYLTGAVMPKLTQANLNRIPVPCPSIDEQRSIAKALGALDDKVELNRRTSQTLEAMAQAIFRAWFVDFEHDWPADGWSTKPLDVVADFLNGLALQKYPAIDGEDSLPVIKIAQLRAGHTKTADRAGTNVPEPYVINDGDLLFSWSGSLEVDLWCGGRGALNQHLFKVTSQVAPPWFAYLWTKHHLPEFRAIAANKATTMGHIQRKHLTAAEVLLPPPAVLEAMDKVMQPIIDQMIQLRLEARTLAELRDELLPKLMSGELQPDDGVVTT